MTKIVIILDKEDIVTKKLRVNYQIEAKNNIQVVFTPDAFNEFAHDVFEIEGIKLPKPKES